MDEAVAAFRTLNKAALTNLWAVVDALVAGAPAEEYEGEITDLIMCITEFSKRRLWLAHGKGRRSLANYPDEPPARRALPLAPIPAADYPDLPEYLDRSRKLN